MWDRCRQERLRAPSCSEVASSIEKSYLKAEALATLATALAQVQQWEQAREVASSIERSDYKAVALRELATALAQAQQREQAREVATSIEESYQKAGALRELVTALVTVNENELVLHIVQQAWLQAETRDSALKLFPLACGLISLDPEVGRGLYEAFRWVDSFLRK